MNPLFNSSGYVLCTDELRVLQKEGWVTLPLAAVAEIKKRSFATFVVRLSDGKRKTLELSHLTTDAFSKVSDALRNALHQNRSSATHPR